VVNKWRKKASARYAAPILHPHLSDLAAVSRDEISSQFPKSETDRRTRAFTDLKLPVLEASTVPLGNVIDATEWTVVTRRRRRCWAPSSSSPVTKSGVSGSADFKFQKTCMRAHGPFH
jgi:hypothetical protein